MKIGMITDSLPGTDFDTLLATAARLELDMLEFGCGNWSSAPHLNLDRMLLHSPPFARGWNSMFAATRNQLQGPRHINELAICAVARLNNADYEWIQHAPEFLAADGKQAQLRPSTARRGRPPRKQNATAKLSRETLAAFARPGTQHKKQIPPGAGIRVEPLVFELSTGRGQG